MLKTCKEGNSIRRIYYFLDTNVKCKIIYTYKQTHEYFLSNTFLSQFLHNDIDFAKS